jgi:hypothetical protein
MGGSKKSEVHSRANFLVLCGSGTTGCHGWVEHNRAVAREFGYLVPRGIDPTTVPVNIRGHWRNLTEFGYDTFLPPEA